MKAIAMTGAAGDLELVDLPGADLRPGTVLVEVAAAGINFMDIGVRRGMAWADVLEPKVIGVEGAGRIIALGEACRTLRSATASHGFTRRGAMRNGWR